MADSIHSTQIGNFVIGLEMKSTLSEQVKEINTYLQEMIRLLEAAGVSKRDAMLILDKALREIAKSGKVATDVFRELLKLEPKNSPLFKTLQELSKSQFKWLPDPRNITNFVSALDMGMSALASFKAAFAPGREMYEFLNRLAEINQRIGIMSQTTTASVGDIAAVGSILKGLGGSGAEYAFFKKSFEMEMERRRRNQGDGGKFTRTLATYGLNFDSGSFDKTFRNYIKFFSENKGTAKAVNVKEMLGISDALYALMSEGQAYWDKEVEEAKRRTAASEEASVKGRQLKEATSKITAAWENLKNTLLIEFAPVLTQIANWIVSITDALGGWKAKVILAVGVIGAMIGWMAKFVVSVGYGINGLRALNDWIHRLGVSSTATAATPTNTFGKSQFIKPLTGGARAAGKVGRFFKGIGGKAFWGLAALDVGMSAMSAKGQYDAGDKAGAAETMGGSVGSLIGGAAGMAIGAALAPVTGGLSLLVPLLAGAAGGFAGDWLGRKTANLVVPQTPVSNTVAELPMQAPALPENFPSVGSGSNVTVERIEMNVVSNQAEARDVADEVKRVLVNELRVIAEGPALMS